MSHDDASARAPRRVLVTGFGPFAGVTDNPSAAVARALDGLVVGNATITGAVLPVTYAGAPAELARLVARHQPDLVICLGLAAGETGIRLETRARNRVTAPTPDNDGACPTGQALEPGAPAELQSSLLLDHIARALKLAGVPCRTSQDAGGYVCNAVFYACLRLGQSHGFRGGFIHLPDAAAMALPAQIAAIRSAIAAGLRGPAPKGRKPVPPLP